MNTNINFTHFRFATRCFESRQEMFEFVEYKPETYDFSNYQMPHLLILMEIEITEAIRKTVSLANKHKEKAIQEYEKLKQALAHLKYIQSKQIYRNYGGGCYNPRFLDKYKGYFFLP